MISIGSLRSTTSTSELAKLINTHGDVQTASAQKLAEKFTIIIRVKRSEIESKINPDQSNLNQSTPIKIEAEVVLKVEGSQISSQTAQPVSFYSATPMSPGELLAVFAEMSGQSLTLNSKSMNHLSADIQLQLQKFLPKQDKNLGMAALVQVFPEFTSSLDQLLKILPTEDSLASESITTALAQLSKSKLPLEWLHQQNFQYSAEAETLPAWLKDIPNMSLRNLQTHNLSLLEYLLPKIASELKHQPNQLSSDPAVLQLSPKQKQMSDLYKMMNDSSKPMSVPKAMPLIDDRHHNILATSFLLQKNTMLSKDGQLQASLEKIQNWMHLQQRWLLSPESILSNLNSLSQMLPDKQGLNIATVNTLLEKIWPSYSKISEMLSNIHLDRQAPFQNTPPANQKLLLQLIELIEAEEKNTPKHSKLDLLHALTLKSGMSEVIQTLVAQNASDDNQQKIPLMSMPVQLANQDSKAWMQVHIESRQPCSSNNSNLIQVLTLDFETSKYGAIRFELIFNQGFQNPQCQLNTWFEHQNHADYFQKYEYQLAQRLEQIGLKVSQFQWRKGVPRVEEQWAKPNTMFHIDQFV